MEIWESKPPGSLWATPGLLWDCLPPPPNFKLADTLNKKESWYFSTRTKSANFRRPPSLYSLAWSYLTLDVSFINEAPKTVSSGLCDCGSPEAAELFTGSTMLSDGSKELAYLPCKFIPSARACCHHIFCIIIINIIIITVMNKM